jgi:transcriptional regulator with XRE-family HTH domain
MSQWEADVHARIARAIKKHRAGSAQDLADRTAKLGYPISRAQIANYESGRKKNLDIAELLILAAALEVPPLVLLYPDLPSGKVEVIPDKFGRSFDAYRWATGMAPSFTADSDAAKSNGNRLIEAVLDRHGKMLERNSMQVRLDLYGHEIEPPMREARERLVSILGEEIDQLNAVIRECGGDLGDA